MSRSIPRQLVVYHKYYNNAGLLTLSCQTIHSGRRAFRLLFRIPMSRSLSPMQTYTKSIHHDARTQIRVGTHTDTHARARARATLDTRVGRRGFVTATGVRVGSLRSSIQAIGLIGRDPRVGVFERALSPPTRFNYFPSL